MSDGQQSSSSAQQEEDVPSSENIVGVELFSSDEVNHLRFENPSQEEDVRRRRNDNRFAYNMRVRTEHVAGTPQLPITGNEEQDSALMEIHLLAQASQYLPRDVIIAKIREIQDKMKPKPVLRPRLPRPSPFVTEIDRDHPIFIRQFYSFVLTGNTTGHFRVVSTPVHFGELDFMDDILKDLNDVAIYELVKFLLKLKEKYFCRTKFLLMVYLKFVFASNQKTSKQAIDNFDKICDTGSLLFQFMSLSEKLYNHIHGAPDVPQLSKDELLRKRLARFEKMNVPSAKALPPHDTNSKFSASHSAVTTLPSNSAATSSQKPSSSAASEIVPMDFDKPIKKKKKKKKKKRIKVKHPKPSKKPVKVHKKCKLKLRHKSLRKCFTKFLDATPPGLLLFFMSRDVEWERKEEYDFVDFKYLFKHLHPKITKDADLKNLIIINHLSGNEKFREQADNYVEQNPVLQNTENIVLNGIITTENLKTDFAYKGLFGGEQVHNRNSLNMMLYKWGELGKRIWTDVSDTSTKCVEFSDEYSLDQEKYFRLTYEHIIEHHRYQPKVWVEIVEDLPYMLVLEKLEFIFERNQLIGNKQLVFKLQMIIESINRVIAAKVHPTQIISLYFTLRQKTKKNRGSTKTVQNNKDKVLKALYRAFHLCLQSDDMKQIFSTHKRHCIALDLRPQMFEKKRDSAFTPIEAALCYVMCLYYYEEYFHIYAYNKEMDSIKQHFTRNFELNELRDTFQKMKNEETVNYHAFLHHAFEKRIDTDAFVFISSDSPNTDFEQLSTLMTTYRTKMHRPDTSAFLWQLMSQGIQPRVDSPVCLLQGVDKNVYYYLNAAVRFAGITAQPVLSAACEASQPDVDTSVELGTWRVG
ncbi:uncharacterized protein [Clytia hemisphaerica]|uniref:RNA-binding protein RO60 vWA domain-containing protein n=1 Tax=Clytia hemisphaerica TaxID=252671 RepID=A0A7M5VCY5_9CNID